MISKDLLSEVLGVECWNVKNADSGALYVPDNCIGFESSEHVAECINIHELGHKVKEWAYENGYAIYATQYAVDEGEWCLYIFNNIHNRDAIENITATTFKTEPEAIIKAGEWILERVNDEAQTCD